VFTLITTHQRKEFFKILTRLEESGNMLSTLHFPLPIGAMANFHNKKLPRNSQNITPQRTFTIPKHFNSIMKNE
jgi:hypothetical protein